jgi:hypothetical protein
MPSVQSSPIADSEVTMRRAAVFLIIGIVLVSTIPAHAFVSRRVRITGTSPFATCTADDLETQGSIVFPASEVEPYVTVSPANSDHIVATWQQDRFADGGARGTRVAVSFDRGRTWAPGGLPDLTLCSDGTWQRASDPWLDIAADGTVYQMSLVVSRNAPLPYRSGMTVSRSDDGGLSWSMPTVLVDDGDPGILHDKNSLTADPLDAAYAYAVWDTGIGSSQPATFTRTTDGGATWEPARRVYTPGTGRFTVSHQIVTPVVGGAPVLLDFFVETGAGSPKIRMIRSDDRGATWSRSSKVVATQSNGAILTPNEDLLVRAFGGILFDVAVDPTSNRIYVVWQDARNSDGRWDAILMTASGDLGVTWSKPIRVNRTPHDENHRMNQAFIPSISVAANGTVAVSYFDFRSDGPATSARTDYWAVMCRPRTPDDCTRLRRWNREVRLTNTTFDITDAPFAGGYFIGDYMGLDTIGTQGFISAYSRPFRDDTASVFTRRFNRKDATPVAP